MLALDGNEPCGAANSGFRTFTWSTALQRARIDKALAALGVNDPPADGYTLVGYSAGASIAENIHQKWPALFPRVVLIAPPVDLSVDKLRKARGVVTMSCSRDVPWMMKEATRRLVAAHVPSTYLEMPGCTHGMITEGERIFGEAFDWLDQK